MDCFQRDAGNQVSDENPTEVLEDEKENPDEVTSEANPDLGNNCSFSLNATDSCSVKKKKKFNASAKSIDPGQPVQSAQVDLGQNFLL